MKKIYLFIFLIVIGLSQPQSVKASISKTNKAAPTKANRNAMFAHHTNSAPNFAPTITFAALGNKAFSTVDLALGATSNSLSNIPITYTSSNPAVATIVNGNVHYVGLGQTTITASQGGGTDPNLPANVSQTLTVVAPTITFPALGTKAFTPVDLTPAVTLTMPNIPVTYTSSNTAVATIVNGNIHYVGIGTATITASQSAAATAAGYPAPADATSALTVGAATVPTSPAITFAALGSKVFSNSELALSATSTATNAPAISYTSSNPAVAIITNTLALGAPNGGSGYANGTYLNVPLTGGSGSGELATIVVSNSIVTTVTPTTNGSGYQPNDVLSCAASSIGGSGSGFSVIVISLTNNLRYISASPAPNNYTIITASQGGGVLGNATLPPDVQNTLTVTPPTLTLPTLGTKPYSSQDIAVGGSSTITNKIIAYTSSNPAVATINNTITGTITTGGSSYVSGTYYKVPILGGTGSGATATITTSSGAVSAVTITANGGTYAIGDVLTCASSSIGGAGSGFTYTVTGYTSTIHFNNAVPAAPNNTTVITASQGGGANGIPYGNILSTYQLVGGTGYANGTYNGIALTGGSGTGATANIVVANGSVTTIYITNGGSAYATGDVLTAASAGIGGGSGFSVSVLNNAAIPPDVSQTLTVTQPAINFPPLGTKQFTTADLNPGATGSNFSSSSISTLNAPTAGSGYTNGTYYAVALTGGSGTGATATITVIGGVVTSVIPVSTGINYVVGDILTCLASSIGGTGSGFQVVVGAISTGFPITYTSSNPAVATIVNNYIHFVSTGTTTITASQNGPAGANTGNITLPPSVSQTLTVTPPAITFPAVGTRTFSSTDVNPGATSTITTVPITYNSSNTAVATITNNAITSTNTLVKGAGYVNGIYTNVPLTGGTGTGAKATITVSTLSQIVVGGTVISTTNGVTAYTITSAGSGYSVGDILSCAVTSLGGTSTNTPFSVTVSGVGSTIHFVAPGTTTITASQGGGATGTSNLPADVNQTLTITPPTLTMAALGSVLYGSADINPAAVTSLPNIPITYTSSNNAVAKILTNSITALNNPTGGSNYVIGTYSPVPLKYANNSTGTGTGATAQILVVGGSVTGVTILSGGSGYNANDQLTCDASQIGGSGTGFTVSVASAGGIVNLLGTGTTTITASQGGGATGTATLPADVSQVLTVAQNTISMQPFGTQVLTATDLDPGAVSSLSTVPIVYTSSNTSVATILNGFIHFVGAGSTVIKASQGGGAGGSATLPADATQTLVVSAPQITFPALPTGVTTLSADIIPAATSTVATPAIAYASSNTAVATIVNGNIHVVGAGTSAITASQGASGTGPLVGASPIIPGSAYTNGTYNAVALTGGSGTGALATVVVASGAVSSVSITTGGTGYKQGDILSAAAANIGGTGAGFSFTGLISLTGAVNQTQLLTVSPTAITLPTLGTKQYTDIDFNPGATSTYPNAPFVYYSSNPNVATIVKYPTLSAPISGGTGYTNGTYTAVPLLLNGVAGATTATVVVSGGSVTAIKSISTVPAKGTVITLPASTAAGSGSGFSATVTGSTSMVHLISPVPAAPNNTTVIAASQGGSILTGIANLAGGSGYTNGAYTNVPIIYSTSGTGIGAIATIVVSGGAVTSVTIANGGRTYKQGDVLTATANIGGGTGFSFTAVTTNTNAFPDDATQTLTVVAPAITFPALGTITYNNNDINPNATSTVAGTPIIYTSSNTAVATIVNGQIHIINAGTTTITASQGGGATGANGLPADATQTLTITGAPTITFAALGSKALNSTDLAPGATSTYTLAPITYTSSNTAVATIVNGNIHFVGTGATTITASQGGGTTSNGVLPVNVTSSLTVTAPTITFAAIGSKALTDVDLVPGATSTISSAPIIYTSSNTAVATIVNGNIHFIAPGTATIKASQGGGASGTATLPADVSSSLTVTVPVITFGALASKPYQLNDIGLGATSTLTTVPITYTSSNTNVATIVNNAIHIVGVGTTSITASQSTAAVAAGYVAPTNVSQSFTVTTPTLTLATLGSKVFTSTDLALTTTGSINSAAPVTYTTSDPTVATIVNGNYLHYVGIGSCTVTASQGSYQGSPVPANSTQNLTVTPATLTFASLGTKLINSGDITLGATSTLSGPAIVYTSSDPTVASITGGNVLHLAGVGTCTITASQPTSANYQPTPVSSTLVLLPALTSVSTPTITFQPLGSKPFSNNGDYTPSATASNSAVLSYTSSNPDVATIVNGLIHPTPPSIVNGVVTYPSPNTTVITASAGGGPNGIPGTTPADVSQTLTITPASITFPPLGQQIFPTTATVVLPNLNQVRFNTNDLAPAATSTYQLVDANNIAVPITYTSSNPNVATIVNGNIHFVGLGITTITASLGNVVVPDVSQNLEVIAPAITFAATRSVTFGTIDVVPGATSTLSSVPITYTSSNPAVATIVNGNIHMVSAGVTTITATQPAIGNSTIPAAATQVLTISATGTLTFTATRSQAFSLTDLDPGATSTVATVPITYTSNNPALVSIVNNKLHFNVPTTATAGNTAIITATQAGANGVAAQTLSQTLTVTPIVIAQTPLNKYYGDADFSPAISSLGTASPVLYTSGTTSVATAVTNGITITASGQAGRLIHIVGTGTSTITASSPADNTNAAAANASIALTVVQAPMSITPKNVTYAYGTPLISFPLIYDGFKSASGNVPLDDSTKFSSQPVVSINGRSPNGFFGSIPVGTYQLTASGAVSTLYTFTYGQGTLTIVPAVQTLTWDNFNGNRSFGGADFDPLARSTGDPIVYTSSNPAVATIVNGQVHITGIGTTTITASISPTSGNYTGTASISKTLTIGAGAQTITVATIPYQNKGAAAFTPNATASSGLPVTMVSSDPTIVKVVGSTLVPLHVGSVTITFSQPGNANYQAAPNVTQYVQVVDPSGAVVKVDQAVSPNGDGINDFLYIEGLQNFPDNHVKIINRNGDKVYGSVSYNNKDVAFTGKDSSGHYLPAGTYFYLIDWNAGGESYHITGYFVLKY